MRVNIGKSSKLLHTKALLGKKQIPNTNWEFKKFRGF